MKSCQYCDNCVPSLLHDRIILGIHSHDTREEVLKERKLTLEKCIDVCKPLESASSHSDSLKPASVNRLQGRSHMKCDIRDCKFRPFKHPVKKEECPAWGKKYKNCGRMNHHDSKWQKTTAEKPSAGASAGTKYHSKKGGKSRKHVTSVDDELSSRSESKYEQCNTITTPCPSAKSVKCKMLVGGEEVIFLINTGALIIG